MRRIGHTGTLDPGACGVLVLCLGHATRIAEFLIERRKGYRSEFTLGVATDSGDEYGRTLSDRAAADITRKQVEDALAGFVGAYDQVPPMVSAVHKGGRRLYERARRGEVVEVEPRRVEILECRLLEYTAGDRPKALVQIECTKGTYVRAIARDLGERLGCGAHASFVLRTSSGRFTLEQSLTLEELTAAAAEGRIPLLLQSPDAALDDFPVIDLTPAQRAQVMDGRALPLFQLPGWQQIPLGVPVRLRDQRGLIALGKVEAGRVQPFRVVRGRGAS
jgi:tRNA pseudouridine55 synthase